MSKPQWNKVLRQRLEEITEWQLLNEDGVMVAKVFPDHTWEVYRPTGVGLNVIRRGGPHRNTEQAKIHAVQAAFNVKLIQLNMNAQILPDELIALQRVIDFAKENGFPDAHSLFWDDDYPEHGMTSINDIVQERGEKYRIRLGIELGGKPLIAVREWDGDMSEDQIVFKPNATAMARAESSTNNESE